MVFRGDQVQRILDAFLFPVNKGRHGRVVFFEMKHFNLSGYECMLGCTIGCYIPKVSIENFQKVSIMSAER